MTPNLSRSWKGLYVVIKRINDVVCRIQLGPRTKPRVVHHNRLWKYSGQSPPTWLRTMAEQASLTEMHQSIEGEAMIVQTRRKVETAMEAILMSSAIIVQREVFVDESHLSITARTLKTNGK